MYFELQVVLVNPDDTHLQLTVDLFACESINQGENLSSFNIPKIISDLFILSHLWVQYPEVLVKMFHFKHYLNNIICLLFIAIL